MAGQVAYHLLAQAGAARAPWPVTTIVSCLPVLVLAMGTTLAHMLRADAGTAADGPDHGSGGPAVSRSHVWSAEDQAGAAPDRAAPMTPLLMRKQIASLHPGAEGWAFTVAPTSVVSLWHNRPATSLAYHWLWEDLRRLHMVKRLPPTGDD